MNYIQISNIFNYSNNYNTMESQSSDILSFINIFSHYTYIMSSIFSVMKYARITPVLRVSYVLHPYGTGSVRITLIRYGFRTYHGNTGRIILLRTLSAYHPN